jgi:hypothetical protein
MSSYQLMQGDCCTHMVTPHSFLTGAPSRRLQSSPSPSSGGRHSTRSMPVHVMGSHMSRSPHGGCRHAGGGNTQPMSLTTASSGVTLDVSCVPDLALGAGIPGPPWVLPVSCCMADEPCHSCPTACPGTPMSSRPARQTSCATGREP